MTGTVEDGSGNPLSEVKVYLVSPDNSVKANTSTERDGTYQFTDDPGDYKIQVELQHDDKPVNGNPILRIRHGSDLVSVETETFTLLAGETKQVDITFGQTNLTSVSGAPLIPVSRLADLASAYVHSRQAIDFAESVLGVSHNLALPIDIFAYSGQTSRYLACFSTNGCTSTGSVNGAGADVRLDDDNSNLNGGNKREKITLLWHELFHELMEDAIVYPTLDTSAGDDWHNGFTNSSTAASWAEGWANFWPSQAADWIGMSRPELYLLHQTQINLEDNHRVFPSSPNSPQYLGNLAEEFAVASLLYDLVDGIDPREDDFLDLTITQFWAAVGDTSVSLRHFGDVYNQLVNKNIGQLDGDTDGTTDLDELFITHGFFTDLNSNFQFDAAQETVGCAADSARPSRCAPPRLAHANLLISLLDVNGLILTEGVVNVSVQYNEFPERSYAYTVNLEDIENGLLALYPPPPHIASSVSIVVESMNGNLSDTLIIDSLTYWQEVGRSTDNAVGSHEFDLGKTGQVTELFKQPRKIKQFTIDLLTPFADQSHSIEKAISHIEDSLENDLWIDDSHLHAQHGHRVFSDERAAVKKLMQLFKTNDDDDEEESNDIVNNDALDSAQTAIDNLVEADRVLAEVQLEDVEDAPTLDSHRQDKVDKELARARDELAKGDAARDAAKPDDAIQHYRKAWDHATKAIQ